jgi:hypothetical protein
LEVVEGQVVNNLAAGAIGGDDCDPMRTLASAV